MRVCAVKEVLLLGLASARWHFFFIGEKWLKVESALRLLESHVTPLHVNFTPSPEQKMCECVPADVCIVDLSEVLLKKNPKPLCCRFRLSAPPEALSSVSSIGS